MLTLSSVRGNHSVTLAVLNKEDLREYAKGDLAEFFAQRGNKTCIVSCSTGTGMDKLFSVLKEELHQRFVIQLTSLPILSSFASSSETPTLTRARHREHLQHTLAALNGFLGMMHQQDVVLAGEELRYAIKSVGAITGKIHFSEIMDVMFSDFCVGK